MGHYNLSFIVNSAEIAESLNEFIETQSIITVSDFTVESGVCVIFPCLDIQDFAQAIALSRQLQCDYALWVEQ